MLDAWIIDQRNREQERERREREARRLPLYAPEQPEWQKPVLEPEPERGIVEIDFTI